jgi:hypothetical protein
MVDLAIIGICMGLGAFSYIINNGEESIGVDFLGSNLLPIKTVFC